MVHPRDLPRIIIPALYLLFQMFRFVSLVMFAIFMVDCSVFHNQTSVDCDINFTTYSTPGCGPYCWKGMWVGCSALTCIICLFVLCVPITNQYIPDMRPASNLSILRSLLVKQYFWYLNCIVFLAIVYDVVLLSQERDVSGSEQVDAGIILSRLLTMALIFQLNFTYPPSVNHFSKHLVVLYYITLSIFVLDNFCKFVELSIRVAYKLYTVNASASHRELQVVELMLEVVDAALYNHFVTFFWNKIFRGRSDVLMTYSPDLAQSLTVQTQTNN